MDSYEEDLEIYVYPSNGGGNDYIEKNISIWEGCGAAVYPIKSLFFSLFKRKRVKRVAVVNWIEDAAGYNRKRPLAAMMYVVFVLIYCKVFSDSLVWVRHNHKPHNPDYNKSVYLVAIWFLNRLSDKKVCHSKWFNKNFSYVPHPLYGKDDNLKAQSFDKDIDCVCFGKISEYKRVDDLIARWSSRNGQLLLIGSAESEEVGDFISSLISKRRNVTWLDSFIPSEELVDYLKRAKLTALMHDKQSMIVSGAFYHAISHGVNVICNDNEFAREISEVFDFVSIQGSGEIDINEISLLDPKEVVQKALKENGRSAVAMGWRDVFFK